MTAGILNIKETMFPAPRQKLCLQYHQTHLKILLPSKIELGIRKAIGATKQDILTQFLMEAVFLSEFGGIAGIVLSLIHI